MDATSSDPSYDPLLDGDTLHVDDIIDLGEAIPGDKAIRLITMDQQAVVNRNIADIRKSIALRHEYEAKQAAAETVAEMVA